MRTPSGIDCKYFFGDYYRGRNVEECSLLKSSGQAWMPDLCKTCPVPGISRANSCENLRLNLSVSRTISTGFQKRVQVSAFCDKTNRSVKEPHVGCGECHPLPPEFKVLE